MDLFWRHGFEGTSTTQLTAAMGIAQPSLYAAFGSKEALYSEAVELYRTKYGGFLTESMRASRPAKQAIEAMLIAAAKQFADASHPLGCMVSTGSLQGGEACRSVQDGMTSVREAVKDLIRRRLEAARKAGELPAKTDTAALAVYFAAVIQGMAVQARDGVSAALLERLATLAMQAWPDP